MTNEELLLDYEIALSALDEAIALGDLSKIYDRLDYLEYSKYYLINKFPERSKENDYKKIKPDYEKYGLKLKFVADGQRIYITQKSSLLDKAKKLAADEHANYEFNKDYAGDTASTFQINLLRREIKKQI